MNKLIGPTYYVRHPDDSYSVAEPQPSPLSVWEDANFALPAIDTPVWAYEEGLIFFSARVSDGEDGWAWARIYFVPGHSDQGWELDDSPELDAEYRPTHWQHLPDAAEMSHEGKLKTESVENLHDEIARLKKLVYDAWWEGHRAGEDDTMAYERGYRSKAPVWETSDSFKELHGARK